MNWRQLSPQEIEAESFRRIETLAGAHGLAPREWALVRRVIHATGDLDCLERVRFHPRAVEAGLEALRRGRPVAVDTRMLQAGISTGRLARLGVEVICLVDDPEVAREARRRGITRATVALERALPRVQEGIVAIGNAPTALLRLLELLTAGAPPPALVVAVPVGWVNAAESKEAITRQDCPFITFLGSKGGSAVAAAIINALALMALDERPG